MSSGPTCRVVAVIVESFTTMFVKSESRATCKRYDVAVAAVFHASVGERATFEAPSDGDVRPGAGGVATIVVKLKIEEYGPVPPGLVALTRQKYCTLFDNEMTLRDVPGRRESSTTMLPVINPEFVAS